MNNLYDVLDICLQELENGADVESVLARYPDLASELRPILNASIKARSLAASAPSPEVIRRGRAKLLQRASEMREAKVAPRRRMIPLFQRLAISFSLTALFLASGTGLVGASSTALPGENLYPVKLTWEGLRLFFAFDHESRELLELTFENERLEEINELLVEGRHETIQFPGVFMEVNGQTYVSGIRVVILDTTVLPAEPLLNGAAVVVTGRTNAEGFVEAESVELLPAGTIVPPGEPLEIETEHNQNGNENGDDNNGNDGGGDNGNDNVNDNGDDNGNINVNDNDNGNDNGEDNANDNVNDNSNDSSDDSNDNVNDNVNDNSNDSSDDNSNDNSNDNVNDNSNDNVNDDSNDGGGDSNDNSNDNSDNNDDSNDNGGDNSNENDNDGG